MAKRTLFLILCLAILAGCSGGESRKADWITDALQSIKAERYPRIKAVNYWHENWDEGWNDPADLRLDSSPEALQAYKEGVADDFFLTEIELSEDSAKILSPSSGVYHCAFPDFGGSEDTVTLARISDFESLVGKDLAWVTFADNWVGGIDFPADEVDLIWNSGRVPYVKMMTFSSYEYTDGGTDSIYTMQSIADGKFDDDLKQWADDAKASGIPMMVCFGVEVNGEWFPWNGKWNGGEGVGPERFVSAYQHIVTLFRDQGVDNITWVYHVNAGSFPDEEWNSMASYYPGDDYVDWIGISVYGPQSRKQAKQYWETFTDLMDEYYPELAALSSDKPLAVVEFGVTE